MLQKSSIIKTAEIFFISPIKKHYLMELSRNIGVAHTSVRKNLNTLRRLNLITASVEKRGKRKFPFYKANRDNRLFKEYKRTYNLSSLIESSVIDFIEKKVMPRSIVLFGSYARGEDTEESDIDLFVECEKEALPLANFEKKLKRRIELHFNEKFISYPKELKNNIINGIVVRGFLEGYS
ncbi:MAG: nucleotidyltransferase domain-containing protein [Nanoarchaeota archaeon]